MLQHDRGFFIFSTIQLSSTPFLCIFPININLTAWKKLPPLLFSAHFFAVLSFSQQKTFLSDIYSFLENTSVFELNQEEGHTPLIPYMSVNEALVNNKSKSSAYLSLNGSGKFHYSETPEGIVPAFLPGILMIKEWETIPVPSNWENARIRRPALQKCQTPFPPDPPYVPKEYNPTGSYRRIFTIPSSWKGKEIFLRMEKTASASFVWINGNEVGYNEAPRNLPNIT